MIQKPRYNQICKNYRTLSALLWTTLCLGLARTLGAGLEVSPSHKDGIYQDGETIVWKISASTTNISAQTNFSYRILRDNQQVLREGLIQFKNGRAEVVTPAEHPGTLLIEIKSTAGDITNPPVLGGALVNPDKIPRSSPQPAGFDAFWDGKLATLANVPMNPQLTAMTNNVKGISRWQVTLDLPKGQKMRGQIARPDKGVKFPAIIVFQWAGIYGLEPWSVNNHAANGWLALNVMPHDLPIDQAPEFYKEQSAGPLKRYEMIGSEDREKSYFLRMFLACSRAVDYLASRPDWDGHNIVVTGASQGGLQSIVAAGLNPKVTAMMVVVPAGCDATASLADRGVPWPYWGQWMPADQRASALRTAPYFDGINFAARVKCPSLVGFGLLDNVAMSAGISIMTSQLHGPVEKIPMPAANHKGDHAAWNKQSQKWLEAIKVGKPVPLQTINP
ncbi:MAG: acetylxylan esterase [Verrucomicrobiota bacterium]